MVTASTIPCPSCGAEIRWRRAPGEFQCENCGRWLTLRPSAGQRMMGPICGVLVMAGASLSRGLVHDVSLVALAALAVIHFAAAALNARLVKPQIELRDGMVDVVPRPRIPVGVVTQSDTTTIQELPDAGGRSRRLFQLQDPPHTLEGFAIGLVAALFVIWQGYQRAEPLVYRIYPEFRATRTGPSGFPITVHIGSNSLQVMNRSEQAWLCGLRIGSGAVMYSPLVTLAAGATRNLPFTAFTEGNPPPDPATFGRLARVNVDARCRDQQGKVHSVSLPGRF